MRPSILRQPILAVLFLTILSIAAPYRAAATVIDTLQCGRVGILDFGPVLTGGRLDTTIIFVNTFQDSSLVVLAPSDTSFRVGVSNVFIPLNTSQVVGFFFRPQSVGLFFDTVVFVDSGHNCRYKLVVSGVGIGPTTNGASYNLLHQQTRTIALKGTQDSIGLSIEVKNDSTVPITIDSVYFRHNTHFTIETRFVQHQTIAAGSSLTIPLMFRAGSYGDIEKDSLIVKPNNPIVTEGFAVQGLRLSESRVAPIPHRATYVTAYPNPAITSIVITATGLHRTSLIVTDLLGRALQRAQFASAWTWDRHSESGMLMPAGTYYICVTGWDQSGVEVQEVVPVVLQ